jgi:hypothetical protein
MSELAVGPLLNPAPPWLWWLPAGKSSALQREVSESGMLNMRLRGAAMRNVVGMFSEFSRVLEFPEYFGRNWNGFEDCLRDLAWLRARGYVLSIQDADQLLIDEPSSELRMFVRIMRSVAAKWSEPIHRGESWDHPAVPLHVVLEAPPSASTAAMTRFAAASAPGQIGELVPGANTSAS